MGLKVSELAERTGISPDTLRYYGRLGLLAETGRTAAGHRYYDETAVERLRFIKGAQWLDLSLGEIRELLEMLDGEGCPCGFSVALVRRRLAEIDAQRSRLDEMHALLTRLLDAAASAPDSPVGDDNGGCTCCQPAAVVSTEEEIRELEERRVAVERRLHRLLAHRER